MKVVKIDDNTIVRCIEDGRFYACFIKEKVRIANDKVAEKAFSSKIEKGDEEIIRKAKAMISAEKSFIKDHPEYKK